MTTLHPAEGPQLNPKSAPKVSAARLLLAAVVALALLCTACSDGDAVTQAERITEPTAIPVPTAVDGQGRQLSLTVVDGGDVTGLVVVDNRGFAVYGVTGETVDALVCAADCASVWIPVEPRQGSVMSPLVEDRFGAFERPDGSTQVTYDNIPLYTWTGDSAIGITGGAGVAGTWFALTEAGGFVQSE